jgi:hypothetical protein
MKTFPIIIGLVCGSVALTGVLRQAQAHSPKPQQSEFPCEIKLSNGQIQNLTALCGQTSNHPNAMTIPQIDPNTPAPVDLLRSSQPSALWNTLPDLPNPPQVGKTAPVSNPSNRQQPATNPMAPSH